MAGILPPKRLAGFFGYEADEADRAKINQLFQLRVDLRLPGDLADLKISVGRSRRFTYDLVDGFVPLLAGILLHVQRVTGIPGYPW